MLKELIISFQSYYKAHQFIRRHKLWKWIIIPGVLYAILFFAGFWFFLQSSNEAIHWFTTLLGIPRWLESMHSTWLNFFVLFDDLILRLVLLLFYFSLFKYLILIIGSPLFAYLSQRTEAIMTETEYRFSFRELAPEMGRGIALAVRNALWQTVYTFTLLLVSFIPLVGWITPLVAFIIECYYYGFSMLDHSCAHHQLTRAQSIDFIGERRGLAIGNGIVFYAMHLVLVLGWIVAPTYALVAAALSLYPVKQESL
ncbi:MAG TPA: EI24 domain-containing protein [Dinghuibacter sp.]|uniref:EI24 domain-containing protein n=1 Tax=Dinghuibacter sp. TaxID=2024697 RepID=UPI002BC91EDA|nr:EI24 domain-containing protein [Dinghuibacter sp.]HTJ14382.1 EI24 domain-containing protein [Dinghuibacter sp.]